MKTSRLNLRRSLFACAAVLLAMTTACSDSVTGPSAKKRSGYITASSDVKGGTTTTTTPTTPTGTKSGVPVKDLQPQSSGYNVTAF